MKIKLFTALKAFIINNNKILILKESSEYGDSIDPGIYDIPGGRAKPGQRFDENLKREIKEETGLTVKIGKPFHVDEWRPVVRGEQWQIIGTFFECTSTSDNVLLSKDHDGYKWIEPEDYTNYKMHDGAKNAFREYVNKIKQK